MTRARASASIGCSARARRRLAGRVQALLVLAPLENELGSESPLAWRQPAQVLTHGIINSLTPIRSLSRSALALSVLSFWPPSARPPFGDGRACTGIR